MTDHDDSPFVRSQWADVKVEKTRVPGGWEPFVTAPTIEQPSERIPNVWESAGMMTSPVVAMAPTSFRTYTLPVGADPVRVVGAAPYAQRVIMESRFGNPFIRALIAYSPNELSIPSAVIPAGAISLNGVGSPVQRGIAVFIVAPDQPLFAIADRNLGGAISVLSVSVSQVVPVPTNARQIAALSAEGKPTSFRTYVLPAPIPAGIPIASTSRRPLRVVIRANDLTLRITTQSNEIAVVGPPPSGAYRMGPRATRTFILAPNQFFSAGRDAAGVGVDPTFSVSTSETNPLLPRGATGIPGPDAQE